MHALSDKYECTSDKYEQYELDKELVGRFFWSDGTTEFTNTGLHFVNLAVRRQNIPQTVVSARLE